MSLKNKFLSYAELMHNAENLLQAHGPGNVNVVKAFEQANDLKREILNRIEELEKLAND